MLVDLIEQWLTLQAGIKYVRASERLLLDEDQLLEEKEATLTQSLSLATAKYPCLFALPVEVQNRIISFLSPFEEPTFNSDHPELRFDLYDLHSDCIARTVVPRFTVGLSLPVGSLTPMDTEHLQSLIPKGVKKFNIQMFVPSLRHTDTAWETTLTTEGAFNVGLKSLKKVLSIPDCIGRVQYDCLDRPAWAMLPVWEALGPHLLRLEELTMDRENYNVRSEEGLAEKISGVVKTALQQTERDGLRTRLRRCSLECSLLSPLANAGLLRSLTHLRLTWHYNSSQTLSPTSVMQGLSGLHSLQVLDLDGTHFLLPVDETNRGTMHLMPSLWSLYIPGPSFLDAFSTSTSLLRLGITESFNHETEAAFDQIAVKFPALEELRMVCLQTSLLFQLCDETLTPLICSVTG